MIEVNGLTKRYGEHIAIDSLNFSVNKGEVVGFLGPNGAGKSTTMKIITGFMAPTSGTAQVAGFDVFENPIEVKKRIGYLPETPPVYLDMYVEDYLKYVAQLKGVPKGRISAQVGMAIEKTSLGNVKKRLIHNLSKGFRQRVGIAQAVVSDPQILILDEPTVGLDPKQVMEIRELIKELRGQHTIILSTHILPEVQQTCERIIIIHNGKIVAKDSLENLTRLQTGVHKVRLITKKSSPDLPNILSKLSGVVKVYPVGSGAAVGVSKSAVGAEGKGSGAGAEGVGAGSDSRYLWNLDSQDEQVVEVVAKEVIEKGFGLLEIRSEKADLEDIFLKLTYGDMKQKER